MINSQRYMVLNPKDGTWRKHDLEEDYFIIYYKMYKEILKQRFS